MEHTFKATHFGAPHASCSIPMWGIRSGCTCAAVCSLGSSSEAQLCVRRMKQCDAKGIGSRMVSMPSWGQFEKKQLTYRDDAVNASALAVGRNDTKLLS